MVNPAFSAALIAAVSRLVREMPRNAAVLEVDRALKDALSAKPVDTTAAPLDSRQSNAALDTKSNKPPFDKKTYQRDLMRKRRAKTGKRAS